MLIHNIEDVMPKESLYRCTNKRQKKFLTDKGLQFIAFGKKYWVYLQTAELVRALDDWDMERRDTA